MDAMRLAINQYDGGPIFVYRAPYERGRLDQLVERHPDRAELLQRYIDRLVDLLPLVKENFYDPRTIGEFLRRQ
jgi:Domain of unknown function(DUF2779)